MRPSPTRELAQRCTTCSDPSASAAATAAAASQVMSARLPSGIAVSRIALTTNGGTSPSSAEPTMASRNTTIVPRYGRANDHTRRRVRRDTVAPSMALVSRGPIIT